MLLLLLLCVGVVCVVVCALCVLCLRAFLPWNYHPHAPLHPPPTNNQPPPTGLGQRLPHALLRTHNGFFWSQRPGKLLLAGAIIALGISTALACAWPAVSPDGIPTEGMVMGAGSYKLMPLWVWIYCIVWWWIQDAVKVRCGGGRARGVRGACCARVCVCLLCASRGRAFKRTQTHPPTQNKYNQQHTR